MITLYQLRGGALVPAAMDAGRAWTVVRAQDAAVSPRVFAKEYLGLNPLGTIPLLLDGDTRMTESAAIAQYLVTRYGPTPLAVGIDEPDFGAYLNWLHFGEATLTFPQTLVLRYTEL